MRVSGIAVCCLALSSLASHAGTAPADRDHAREARRSPVVQVFESNRDAVVNISSKEILTVRDPFADMFQDLFDVPFGPRGMGPRQYTRTSVGSGFVIHPDGYIVTNAHVVAQTAERKAMFADGREYEARIVATDSSRDLAILKVDADRPLPTIRLGRSDDIMIGETVIAIGNALGYQNTVTAGVVSAINRDLQFAGRLSLTGLIQTDASINPGNSGGPLLNVLGDLIGVNSAIRGDAQNIGFAIPVDQLREVLPELLDIERRYRIQCGLSVDTLHEPRVTAVQQDSPAEKAGIQIGDVLKGIDGRAVREGIDFSIALIGCKPGQRVELDLDRSGMPTHATLTLTAKPVPDGAALARQRVGLVIDELPNQLADRLGLPADTGLLVVTVERGGAAERSRIGPRDVLVSLGRHSVGSLDDLGQLLEVVRSGDLVPVTMLRTDGRMLVKMTIDLRAR